MASIEPRTDRFPPAWQSCTATAAESASPRFEFWFGTATGLTTPSANGTQVGPPHPGADSSSQVPSPSGCMRTAWPAATGLPATVKPLCEVTITSFPSFSVSATRMAVPSCCGVVGAGTAVE